MKNRHIILAAISLLSVSGYGWAKSALVIAVPDDMPAMEIPVEMRPGPHASAYDVIEVTSDKAAQAGMLLQSTPSLFFSPSGFEMQRTFCTVLPGGIRSGRVQLNVPSKCESRFSIMEEGGNRLKLLEDDKPVFVYNYGMQLADGVPREYRRSTYIHPIYDLKGKPITDDFPKDHYHHRGLSWMWPHVAIGGKVYDLWAIRGIRQVFEKWLAREVGPVCATIGVKNAWNIGEHKVMDEWIWIRVFPASQCGRALDFCLTWKALEPVQISGTKDKNKGYGGFCLRFAPRDRTVITTPSGVEDADSDLKRLPWADETGKFGGAGGVTGIAVFQHHDNPDFPAGWCLRHYGFVGVSWPGLETVAIQPNTPLTLRFRIWVHNGDATEGRVPEAYKAFAKPPKLRFID